MNASFDGRPVRLPLESGHLVLIDPLALDGLSRQLADVGRLPVSEQLPGLQALGEHGLRIGAQERRGAAPGTYEISLDAFEAADSSDTDAGVFEIDSGAVIVIDGSALRLSPLR
jgi:hypothetical protein